MALGTNEKMGTVVSGALTDADGRLIVVGPNGGGLGALPPEATPVDASSAVVAAAATTASIPAVAGKTSYITGFEISGGGATAGSIIDVTVTGPTTTLHYEVAVPAGVANQVSFQVELGRAIAASAVNTAITVNVPSFGAGNTAAAVVAHGYQL